MKNTALFAFFSLILLSVSTTAFTGSIMPTPRDKCAVCGMFVSKYPDWTAVVTFNDGTNAFFDGAKDMFTFYNDPKRYSSRKQADISALKVKDYYSLKQVDARQAFFVLGSDVYGPMGNELIPFGRKKDADEFVKDHKGKRVVRFSEVTPALLSSIH